MKKVRTSAESKQQSASPESQTTWAVTKNGRARAKNAMAARIVGRTRSFFFFGGVCVAF